MLLLPNSENIIWDWDGEQHDQQETLAKWLAVTGSEWNLLDCSRLFTPLCISCLGEWDQDGGVPRPLTRGRIKE